jgi:hypothetical protein
MTGAQNKINVLDQPPKKHITKIKDNNIMLLYSPKKKRANNTEEYSKL